LAETRLDRLPNDRAYFTDSDGVRWRVHDCCFGTPLAKPGHRKRLPLETPGTNTRYLVNDKGDQRAYTLKRSESVRRLQPIPRSTTLQASSEIAWRSGRRRRE